MQNHAEMIVTIHLRRVLPMQKALKKGKTVDPNIVRAKMLVSERLVNQTHTTIWRQVKFWLLHSLERNTALATSEPIDYFVIERKQDNLHRSAFMLSSDLGVLSITASLNALKSDLNRYFKTH